MGPFSESEVDAMTPLFIAWRKDIDSVPFVSFWASLADVDERMKEARRP